MAYYVEKKFNNKFLSLLKKTAGIIQLWTMIYAVFTLFYWLMRISDVQPIPLIDWMFTPVWDFVGIFYHYTSKINGEVINYTGVISAFVFIGISNIFRVCQEYIVSVDDSIKAKVKNYESNKEKNVVTLQNNRKVKENFIFLLDIKLTNISNFIQEGRLSSEDMNKLKTKFYEALLNNINENQVSQKGFYRKKLFIIYKDFEYIDNFVFYTRETLNSLAKEFTKPSLKIDFLIALSSIGSIEDLSYELNQLDTIICLDINNEFVTTASFKHIYETLTKKQYKLTSKGIYNLSKNLHVSNNQEIYNIRELFD